MSDSVKKILSNRIDEIKKEIIMDMVSYFSIIRI
jgi:hypothetical protein